MYGKKLPTVVVCRQGAVPRRPGCWLPKRPAWFYLWWGRSRLLVAHLPRWGMGVLERVVRSRAGSVSLKPDWRRVGWMSLKKRNVSSAEASAPLPDSKSPWGSVWSSLAVHVAVNRYEDGGQRTPGYFTIRTEGTDWVVRLVEPDQCASLTCRAPTLEECLLLACLLCESDSAPWQNDPWLEARKPKPKKRH